MNLIKSNLFGVLLVLFTLLHLTSYSQTQVEMDLKAAGQYKKADKELNVVYQKILKEYASQPVFVKKFKAAQRIWLQLRDAELAAKFPNPNDYGSVEPMCEALYLESLTKERTKFLNVWLNGIPEGDVCSGSVKIKQ